jgi:hypothetical protein
VVERVRKNSPTRTRRAEFAESSDSGRRRARAEELEESESDVGRYPLMEDDMDGVLFRGRSKILGHLVTEFLYYMHTWLCQGFHLRFPAMTSNIMCAAVRCAHTKLQISG